MIQEISAKTIITRNKYPDSWFGHDYNMNIYKGCCHGCIYCDSRSECYRVENFDEVRMKKNALEIINKDLRSKRIKGVVGTGAMSDPYNPFEKELMLTRHGLELISAYGFGAAIATKSDLIVRDIDILSEIQEKSPVCIKLTITTFDDKLCSVIEPNVAPTSQRLIALKRLAESGIFCGALLMPILPFINDNKENIMNIVEAVASTGAKFIYPEMGVTLRQNQREYYYEKLDKHFPGIKEKYLQFYGNAYKCGSQHARELMKEFSAACKKNGLLYKMPDIIKEYKSSNRFEQLTLF